jgi:hypothetical protein
MPVSNSSHTATGLSFFQMAVMAANSQLAVVGPVAAHGAIYFNFVHQRCHRQPDRFGQSANAFICFLRKPDLPKTITYQALPPPCGLYHFLVQTEHLEADILTLP